MPTVALFQTDVSARAVQAAPAVIPNSPSVLQEGLAQLRRILMAYAVRNPDLGCALGLHRIADPFYRCGIGSRVGYSYFAACDSVPHGICSMIYHTEWDTMPCASYCQAMNFLAAMMLIHVGEVCAFYGLVWVVETLLAGYYVQTLEGLQADTAFLSRLLSSHNPHVHEHIEELEISLSMLVTSMLMCVFIEVLPESCGPRIWDCFLLDGLSRSLRQHDASAAVARQRSRSGTISSAHSRAQADKASMQSSPVASIHLRLSLALFDDLQVSHVRTAPAV
jgi:hypothetical protein